MLKGFEMPVWRLEFFALGITVCCQSLFAQQSEFYLGVPTEKIERVMDLGYNLDPSTAGLIDEITDSYPDSPLGPCLNAARLFRLDGYAGGTDEELAKQFEKASEDAIEVAKDYYSDNESDPTARYALAMCELNLARYYIENGRWLGGFFKANSGLAHLKGILKEFPDFHDAKMPLGVANCFLDEAPAYLKPIAMLLRFSGDMEKGLQQLHDAETKGFLTKYESLYYQIGIQWELLEDKEKAGEILNRFLERFPNNVDAVVLLGHLRRKQERYQEAFEAYERALSLPEVSYLHDMKDWVSIHMGNTAIHLENPEIGLEIAEALLNSVEEPRKEVRSWAQVLEANAYWHLDKRNRARESYASIRRKDSPRAYKAAKAMLEKMDAEEES
ncbi:MAG TPA: hypothetical protein DIV79_14020 [Opitutae bacterium]|nr:hypothetical protein [Opitutaceae bacterium]HCR31125.1 hypothetical protein [Opitutae bacterium]